MISQLKLPHHVARSKDEILVDYNLPFLLEIQSDSDTKPESENQFFGRLKIGQPAFLRDHGNKGF